MNKLKSFLSKILFWRKKPTEPEKPLEEQVGEHPLYADIHSKGMAGKPVVCLCGDVYGDYWAFCKNCGRRKKELPDECFPFGHSGQNRILHAPKKKVNND